MYIYIMPSLSIIIFDNAFYKQRCEVTLEVS